MPEDAEELEEVEELEELEEELDELEELLATSPADMGGVVSFELLQPTKAEIKSSILQVFINRSIQYHFARVGALFTIISYAICPSSVHKASDMLRLPSIN